MVGLNPGARRAGKWYAIRRDRALYIMLIIPLAQIFVFRYLSIAGLYMSFVNYSFMKGIFESPFVGLQWFGQLFGGRNFMLLLRNNMLLSLYSILFSFPAPILLALCLNEIRSRRFMRLAQTITYMPYFVSTVVVVSIMTLLLSPSSGMVNILLNRVGISSIYFLGDKKWFRMLYIVSEIWQNSGWTAIIYLSAITGISVELYEAAQIDGAGRFRRILHITLPSIMPTILIMLLLKIGQFMEVGYEKVLLMYNAQTMEVADIFDTYVYRQGIVNMNYSYSTTVGLFKALISFALVVSANTISNRFAQVGLW